ncbi:hypothetical protein [Methanopyrus sp.]
MSGTELIRELIAEFRALRREIQALRMELERLRGEAEKVEPEDDLSELLQRAGQVPEMIAEDEELESGPGVGQRWQLL